MWRRPRGFETLVKIILEQQVSLTSAASMFQRLRSAIAPFTPGQFVASGERYFRSIGVTRQKASYLVHLSESIESGQLSFRALHRMADNNARMTLMAVKGIGAWSADIYLLMAMSRADIWPAGDLALALTVGELKRAGLRPSIEEMEALAEEWRPYRAVAARMLWQHYLARRKSL